MLKKKYNLVDSLSVGSPSVWEIFQDDFLTHTTQRKPLHFPLSCFSQAAAALETAMLLSRFGSCVVVDSSALLVATAP